MEDVDFGDAELYYVEFRGLAMDRVTWPRTDANPVFAAFPCVLERMVSALADDPRPAAQGVRAAFESKLQGCIRPAAAAASTARSSTASRTSCCP